MKNIRKILSFVVASLLLVATFAGCMTAFAADGVKEVTVYDYKDVPAINTNGIISDFNDITTKSGIPTSWLSNHGGGQTRMTYTDTGVYYALFTGEDADAPIIGIDLIHVTEDGNATSVFHTERPYSASGPMVSVHADKNGKIWMYTGWGDGSGRSNYFDCNMWKYDPVDGSVKAFREQILHDASSVRTEGGCGYSTTCYDAENNRILAVINCSGKPGFLEWVIFDIEKEEWLKGMNSVKTDYRYCYTFIVTDGNGGYILFNQRDVEVDFVKADNGKSVRSCLNKLTSWWYYNNMLFDEWDYFHIPDPAVSELDMQVPVEPAVYEVDKGLYPDFLADSADVFKDSEGYIHFIYNARECITYGNRNVHVVYDPKTGMKEVYRQTFDFAGSSDANYYCRMFQDTTGAFYVVCTREVETPMFIEIWGASKPTEELKLLYGEVIDIPGLQVAGTAAATSRNGSTMTDVFHMGFYSYQILWYDFSIDFAQLRTFLAR